MGILHIHLFGRVRVVHDDGPEVKMTPKAQTLLAYILLQRVYCNRDVLASLCWGEQSDEHARSCLNTALWRLRRSLEAEAAPRCTYLLTTPAGDVGFNWSSDHSLDLETFQTEAGSILGLPPSEVGPVQASALQKAISIYDGDLLEGFYDDWALRERERVRGMYLDSLHRLAHYHESRGELEESLGLAQKLLAADPLREDVHRHVMRLYVRTGQRALAVRQYKACQEVLADQLGIAPMEETHALYREIVRDSKLPVRDSKLPVRDSELPLQDNEIPRVPLDGELASLPQAMHSLRQAMRQMESAHSQLSKAMRLIERITADSRGSPEVSAR